MELSPLQKSIIEAPARKSVVISAAASGKTRTLTEKVRWILRAGFDPKEIAVVTYTNMAATELRQRLGEDYKDGLFIGTIHSLANYLLLSHGIKTGKLLDEERFDELFALILKNPQCARHYEWILLDEAQDSDPLQFQFLFDFLKPECFFITGDPKQSIYQFRGARPQLMVNLSHAPGVQLFDMNENYRNGYNILNYAKRIIRPTGLEDTSIAKYPSNGAVSEIAFDSNFILNKIYSIGDYRDWAILARTNKDIELMSYILKREKVPFDTFKQGDLTKEDLTKRMEADTVKILTVHSAKGLEWPNVFVMGTRFHPIEERNVCYVAATRAKDNLFWVTKKKGARF